MYSQNKKESQNVLRKSQDDTTEQNWEYFQ